MIIAIKYVNICWILSSRREKKKKKPQIFECHLRKNVAWVKSTHRILGIDVLGLKKNSGYQELQSKHIPSVSEPLKTQIGAVHTSLFSSHHPVFPALVPVPALFPQSGRHRSVPLYLLCVLWQNRRK